MNMSKRDVAKLLAFVAAYDQRTVGTADVEAWHAVAAQARWELTYAQRAVIEHFTDSTDRLMPAHITRTLRERRERYARSYQHKPAASVFRDSEDEMAWEQEQLRAHIASAMTRWANGEDVPA